VVIQGAKLSIIGSEEHQYGEDYCLISCVDMPGLTMVTKASKEKPFLSLSLFLDRHIIARLLAEIGNASGKDDPYTAVSLAKTRPDVLGAFGRLAETTENPEQTLILAPMIIREIHYRVLVGPQGGILRAFGASGTMAAGLRRLFHGCGKTTPSLFPPVNWRIKRICPFPRSIVISGR
jgi:hypothetical protein